MADLRDLMNRALAAGTLAACAPVLGVIAAAVKVSSPGPALYEPEMLGEGARIFRMKKFRSMVVGARQVLTRDDKTVVTKDDDRLTPIGRILRIGFDELPQFLNVLLGEMSIVGPRPDPSWVLPRYTSAIRERLAVKPGITGLAQVLDGRSQRQAAIYYIDVWYAEHQSLALDAAVVALTVPYVLGLRSIGRALGKRLLDQAGAALERYELLPPGAAEQPGYVDDGPDGPQRFHGKNGSAVGGEARE
jgi:lipopolysaccharide/colanic/teichoic acid biosynthesis glycosyltransferase